MIIDLAKIYRGKNIESIHYGIACLANANNVLDSWGDVNFACYTRSIIKPIQAKTMLDSGLKIQDEQLAIAMASHHASEDQIRCVNSLLEKFSLGINDLKCGKYSESRSNLDSPLYHNCSGKHAAILGACVTNHWPKENYFEIDHEYNKRLVVELKKLLPDLKIEFAKDGCGLPTFYMSLKDMAMMFANLIKNDEYANIISTMNRFPDLIGGTHYVDSILMKKYPNKFIAKVGAEGLVMVANLEKGEALVLKIIDGATRARAHALVSLLEHLQWIDRDSIVIPDVIFNSPGDHVGHIEARKNFN